MIVIREAARHLGLDIKGATVAVQGFGNVGSVTADLLARSGAKIVAVTDWKGGIYNGGGLHIDKMLDYARQRKADGADGWVVQHIQTGGEAERLIDACREIYGCEPAFVSGIGPVLAVHTGPGLLGVGGVPRSMLVDD
jgi:glutamate dehydrogenase/leucine dehydrogenase